MSWPWSQLGLPGPSGLSEIRHAYAEKLKVTHPEDDPEGFQKLHSAYQMASRMARQQKRKARIPETERPPRPALETFRQPEEDFDFDELLRESGEQPRRSQGTEPDWDYARLFAEGEAEWAEYRRRGEERRQWDSREEWPQFQMPLPDGKAERQAGVSIWKPMIFGILASLVLLFGIGPLLNWRNLIPTRDPREQVCRYIEEDMDVKVGSLYNLGASYATDAYSNVFYLGDDPSNRQFLAGPDGERDKGHPGYTTNLPEMMVLWALEGFARERKIYNVDTLDRDLKLERWETGGTFVLTLPAGGAGDVITDLGALLEELSREAWYQARLPVCEVVLCGRQMIEGRLILSRWRPADGAFDAEGLRALYESAFAHSYCAQLLKELELDRDFLRGGEARYTLTNEGTATVRDRECYKLFGLDETGAVALEYYVDLELSNIYCFPGNFWESGNSEDQLGIYRVLHWGDDLGLICLFYPWLRVN